MDDIGDKSETQSTTHDKNSDEPSKKGDVINSDENVDESSVSNHVDGGVNSVTNDESQLDTGNGDDVKETEPQLPSTEPEPRSTEPVEKDTVTSPSENKRNDDEDSTKLQTDINDSQVADDNMQDEKVSDLELDKPESPCAEVEDTKPDEPSTEETETSNTAPDSPSKESIETKKSSSESAEKIDESVKNIAECKEKVDKVVTESAEQVDESIGDSIDNVCETITESSSIVKENAGDEDTGKATIEDEQETIEDEQATNDADVSMSDEIENAAEESTEKMDVDCLRESTETKVSQENGDKVKEDALSQDDDLDNIRFENAPKVQNDSMEHCSQQSLDPFDALLNTASDSHNDSSGAMKTPTTDIAELNNVSEDEDAGADLDGTAADTEEQAPEEDIPVADLESAGADEEVCLLPDTEREISEEDKEKALEQRKLAQENQTIKSPHSIVADDVAENNVETGEMNDESAEVTEDAVELADGVDDSVVEGAEVEKEKDKDDEKDEEDVIAEEPLPSNIIQEITTTERVCSQCTLDKTCIYRYLKDGTMNFICHDDCLKAFQEAHPDQYTVELKKNLIEEIEPKEKLCSNCEELKICYFSYKEDGETYQYCSETCLHDMMGDDKDKYSYKRKKIVVEERDATEATCHKCEETKDCTLSMTRFGELKHVCGQQCLDALNSEEGNRYKLKRKVVKRVQPAKKKEILIVKKTPLLKLKVISNATDKYLDEKYKIQARTPAAAAAAREEKEKSFIRKCSQCFLSVNGTEKNLSWETMDFCDEFCLSRYQNAHGSKCANCKSNVNNTSLGKYCVRFGYDIRQFCCSTCLEEFKKGLKICCYCQRDISVDYDGFLAPIGDKGQFKDFCSQQCMEKFDQMSKNPVPPPVMAKCAVCSVQKMTSIEVEVDENHEQRLCSEPCFAAFKFVNSIYPDQCKWCKKYFERTTSRCFTIYDPTMTHCFCSKLCLNVYISNTRHIVPCNWCKVKKYNFDMIKRNLQTGQSVMMCSLNCLNLYQVSVNAVSSRRIKCDQCKRTSQAQYHLTMSDATVRNFCTYQCVMSFQGQYNKAPMLLEGDQSKQAVPTGAPRRTTSMQKNNASAKQSQQSQQQALPVISNVQSLATRAKSKRQSASEQATQASSMAPKPAKPVPIPPPPPPPPPKIYNHVLVKTLPPLVVANKATMTKPQYVSKGISCRPHAITKECQTDDSLERRVLVPIPVPIYVPVPCAMYSLPFPLPVPIPIPIPTPVFIPTTRNSANGIMKEIKKIHDKMPTDPFEAELLMMAEMVAGDKKRESDSETDDEENTYPNESNMEGNQSGFGEDVLQMALKMATEPYDEQVDLESAMTANTITPNSHPITGMDEGAMQHLMVLEASRRGAVPPPPQRKRTQAAPQPPPTPPPARGGGRGRKRRDPPPPEPPREPQEKPDANMCLKYTFGVNAWKQWVMTKNAELEKSSIRRKPFKSEILQLTADELNFSLCLFVKEVRKPNGSEYAPDTIYYLVLGIQQYLFENGRIDNIFTDPYYEKFTDCLDEVARKFSVLYNDSQYIVTRVEEEHLWECKQLGAHSPHVLLSTLMFFNTKHFNLVTVEEHMQLSFSHIMKHWKRNPNQPGSMKVGGSRNVLLRFYPPQSALEANSRKKKVYEQQENEENPLRCPVKLYEFYISKCPESVRTRNDVFYLMPERSCVPDSPVWYSTQPLAREALAKMLHRVKMVKEINIALLTS